MLLYLFLCMFILLAGYGVLVLLRLDRSLQLPLLAAPGVWLGVSVTALVSGISAGATLIGVARVLVVAGSVLAGIGARRLWLERPNSTAAGGLAAALVCPLFLLGPFFWWGLTKYPGSWLWDGWNYVVYGQQLLESHANTAFGSSALRQYIVEFHFENLRFASSALIGLLSLAAGTDAQAGYGPMIAIALFGFASSCGFAAAMLRPSRLHILAVTLIGGTGLWMLGVVQANNLDTLLLLSIAPLLYGLAIAANPAIPATAVLFGMAVAAAICMQVELAPLAMAAPAAVLIERVKGSWKLRGGWLRWALVSGAIALLAFAPWLPKIIPFVLNQIAASNLDGAVRPGGGYFTGLFLGECNLSVMWGFWAPFESCTSEGPYGLAATAVAALLTLLLLIGIVRFLRQGEIATPFATALLIAGALFMLGARRYDYGAYKFLTMAWFPVVLLVVEGALALAAYLAPTRASRAFAVSLCILLLAQSTLGWFRLARFDAATPVKDIAYYSQIQSVGGMTDGPVLLAVNEPLAFERALFFLRYTKLVPVAFSHPYFASVKDRKPFAERRKNDVPLARYLLTDASASMACAGELVWEAGPYRLWHLNARGWAFIIGIQNPNGVDNWNGKKLLWLGGATPTRFDILSSGVTGHASFKAQVTLGPSRPESSLRTIEIDAAGQRATEAVDISGRNEINLPVAPGLNEVTLRVLEKPTLAVLPNGDPRPLLLALTDYDLCLDVSSSTTDANRP